MPKTKITTPEDPIALMAAVVRRRLSVKTRCRASTLLAAVKFMKEHQQRIPRVEAEAIARLLTQRLREALEDPKASGSTLATAQLWFNAIDRKGRGGGDPGAAPAVAEPYPSAQLLQRIGELIAQRGLSLPFPLPRTLGDTPG